MNKISDKSDGLSMENAIKTKTSSEAFDYIMKNYENFGFMGRTRVCDKESGKSYDLIKIQPLNGEIISLYFDILHPDKVT
ncbi:hypothetical protein KRX57_09615 [Weeksellaceae bacterium TAE3-ERU29]|nr:hypothetical protein [Weeksellaceae bacterium TAE3-ERU29]